MKAVLIAISMLILGSGSMYILVDSISTSEQDVYNHIQDAICDQLVCPTTAKFPNKKDIKFETRPSAARDFATISGYFDAENRFGAIIRDTYVCEVWFVKDKPPDESIHIQSLKIKSAEDVQGLLKDIMSSF